MNLQKLTTVHEPLTLKKRSIEEKLHRFEIFKDNLKHIDERNKEISSYWLGLNEFADLSNEEFKNKYLGLKPALPETRGSSRDFSYRDVVDLPKSMDWRKKGAVTQSRTKVHVEEMEVVKISGYQDVPQNDEESLLKALAHQPLKPSRPLVEISNFIAG
ncbi:hypothetical protein SO802_009186 [Lithocarpus litseifolius]|uniref:Cathepsin propeptide inhibitor domain-containing protein n=1 Tax=Lithocarpus litseifolius TaxID=425828 RepID=A0AAW2DC36_9ROSI